MIRHRVFFPWFAAALAVALASACGTEDVRPSETAGPDPATPAADGGSVAAPDATGDAGLPPPQGVVISEIMYHPVEERAAVEGHEFIEVHNREGTPRDISGWKLTTKGQNGVDFTFPAGTTIPPGGYRVVAKDRNALVGVAAYGLVAADVLGDYKGELDNGGTTVTLTDARSAVVDAVVYKDGFPYPIAPDAMGASDDWLARLTPPRTTAGHEYKGHSLERVSADVASLAVSNWAPSPLDGATPGKANASANPAPPTIVEAITMTWSGTDKLIRSADTVTLSVTFSTLGKYTSPQLQYFVDDVHAPARPAAITVPMTPNKTAWEATLPPRPDNSIVRYRIQADRGDGKGQATLSPRPTDPLEWHGYFVTPRATVAGGVASTAPSYHMFLTRAHWTQMWDNIYHPVGPDARRVIEGGNPAAPANRCLLRASWDGEVPGVFVFGNVVYDVFSRYQGSRWNRVNGVPFVPSKTTINPLPDRPANVVLSWKVDFPAYAKFEGKRSKITLHKLNSGCPGLAEAVGERVYGDPAVAVPAQIAFRYARVHINGGYYHYMLDLERVDDEMMGRYLAPGEPMGDLFKSDGNSGSVEGPWGRGDESILPPSAECPNWTVDQRYAYTYERGSNKWAGPAMIRTMIEELNALRTAALASGDWEPARTWFKAKWDVAKIRDYLVLRNWSQAVDFGVHNHLMYRRASDHKWVIIAVDRDREFGEAPVGGVAWASKGTRASFYFGSSLGGSVTNILYDTFLQAFPTEVWERVVELDATVLSPSSFRKKVDDAFATFSLPDYQASPAAAAACNAALEPASMKAWAGCRHQDIVYLKTNPTGTAPACNPANPCKLPECL